MVERFTDGLGVSRNWELHHKRRLVLVLRCFEVGSDGINGLLGLQLLLSLLAIKNLLVDLGKTVTEPGLLNGGDGKLVEIHLDLLGLAFLFGTQWQVVQVIKALAELTSDSLHLMGFFDSHGNDSADSLGDTVLLQDDQIFNIACLLNMSSTAELDADFLPAG